MERKNKTMKNSFLKVAALVGIAGATAFALYKIKQIKDAKQAEADEKLADEAVEEALDSDEQTEE